MLQKKTAPLGAKKSVSKFVVTLVLVLSLVMGSVLPVFGTVGGAFTQLNGNPRIITVSTPSGNLYVRVVQADPVTGVWTDIDALDMPIDPTYCLANSRLVVQIRPRYGQSLSGWAQDGAVFSMASTSGRVPASGGVLEYNRLGTNAAISSSVLPWSALSPLSDQYYVWVGDSLNYGSNIVVIAHFYRLEVAAAPINFDSMVVGNTPPSPKPNTITNATLNLDTGIPSVFYNDYTLHAFPPPFIVDSTTNHLDANFNARFYPDSSPPPLGQFSFDNPIVAAGGPFGIQPVHIPEGSSPAGSDDVTIAVESGLPAGVHTQVVQIRHGNVEVGSFEVSITVQRPITALDFNNPIDSTGMIQVNRTVFDYQDDDPAANQLTAGPEDWLFDPALSPLSIPFSRFPGPQNIRTTVEVPDDFTFFDLPGFPYTAINVSPPTGYVESSRTHLAASGELEVTFVRATSTPSPTPSPTPTPTPTQEEPVSTPTPTPSPTPTPTPSPTPTPVPPTPTPPEVRHEAFIIGYDDGYVRPYNPLSRAHTATIFFRLMTDAVREQFWTQDNPFADVSLESWYNNAISTTTNLGIFTGTPEGYFNPNNATTRAELAVATARFIGAQPMYDMHMFSDLDIHWARGYINAAAYHGWIIGPEGIGGRFLPESFITRAETAGLINRALGRLPRSVEDLLPQMIEFPDNMDTSAWYYLYIQEAANSHTFIMHEDEIHETWVRLVDPRRWYLLERPDSRPWHIFQ